MVRREGRSRGIESLKRVQPASPIGKGTRRRVVQALSFALETLAIPFSGLGLFRDEASSARRACEPTVLASTNSRGLFSKKASIEAYSPSR